MTKKKLVLSTETLRLLSERDVQGVHGGSVSASITASTHSQMQVSCHIQTNIVPTQPMTRFRP